MIIVHVAKYGDVSSASATKQDAGSNAELISACWTPDSTPSVPLPFAIHIYESKVFWNGISEQQEQDKTVNA